MNKEDALKWLKLQQFACWEVLKDGSVSVGISFEHQMETEPTPEKSYNDLAELLSVLPSGTYELKAWRKKNGKQGAQSYHFSIGYSQPPTAQAHTIAAPALPAEYEALKREVEEMKRKDWERETRAKIEKELEAKYAGIGNFDKVMDTIGKVHDLWNAKPAHQNTPAVGKPEATNEPEQVLSKSLETLQEKLGTEVLITTLQQLANTPAEKLQSILPYLQML